MFELFPLSYSRVLRVALGLAFLDNRDSPCRFEIPLVHAFTFALSVLVYTSSQKVADIAPGSS